MNVPVAAPAVYRPVCVIDPPVALHVTLVLEDLLTELANCCDAPGSSEKRSRAHGMDDGCLGRDDDLVGVAEVVAERVGHGGGVDEAVAAGVGAGLGLPLDPVGEAGRMTASVSLLRSTRPGLVIVACQRIAGTEPIEVLSWSSGVLVGVRADGVAHEPEHVAGGLQEGVGERLDLGDVPGRRAR